MTLVDGGGDRLWAITSYYNPVGYARRRENFRHFRHNLHVPLVAVELAFDNDFDLADGDADILIQLRGGDVMWQKERLLNLALKALPPECREVAWLDADVIFARHDWAKAASDLLDQFPMVQLFSNLHYMPPDLPVAAFSPGTAELSRLSAAFAARRPNSPPSFTLNKSSGIFVGAHSTGMAWACRRDLLDEHGFYDRCIVGGGDRAMAAAAWGVFDHAVGRHLMGEAHAQHYMTWATAYHGAVGGGVGVLDGDIFHLWHGALEKRRGTTRHVEFGRLGYDPLSDIALTADGVWRWNSDKPAMHVFLKSYFPGRQEDG